MDFLLSLVTTLLTAAGQLSSGPLGGIIDTVVNVVTSGLGALGLL